MSFVFTSLPVILFILLVKLPFFLVRWLRWLGFAQQKEYRLDRLFAFLRSDEGSAELQRILPKKSEFSRVGMKRPRITPRVLVVAVGSFVLLGALLLISFMIIASFIAGMFWQVLMGALVIGGAYLILPGIVILACFPSALVSAIVIYKTLKTAQRKIQKGSPKIIGLGGSYGKTSTKHLLHHFLSQNATVFVTPKSFNTKYSMAKSICEGYTGQEIALLEYGAYVIGEIEYMTEWFQPHMAVETGFTPQHLSLFGSRENSLNAESELVAALPTDAVVFCNGADQGAVEICERGRAQNNAKIIMYAGEKSAVQLKNLELNEFGQVSVEWNGKRLQTQLIGKQYMVNLQAAIAVSQHLGMSDDMIEKAIITFRPNDSFVQGKVLKTGAYLVDDGGTSNPKGFEAALNLLAELPYSQKILVTAGMIDLGEESESIHQDMAMRAAKMNAVVSHVGIDGKGEFEQAVGEKLITSVQKTVDILKKSDKNTLILLEGKVPKVIEEYLEAVTEKTL